MKLLAVCLIGLNSALMLGCVSTSASTTSTPSDHLNYSASLDESGISEVSRADDYFREAAMGAATDIMHASPNLTDYVVQYYAGQGVTVSPIPNGENRAYLRRKEYIANNPETPSEIKDAIFAGRLIIGMSREQVLASVNPGGKKVSKRIDTAGDTEVWEWKESTERFARNLLAIVKLGQLKILRLEYTSRFGRDPAGGDISSLEKHTWDMMRVTFVNGKVQSIEQFTTEE